MQAASQFERDAAPESKRMQASLRETLPEIEPERPAETETETIPEPTPQAEDEPVSEPAPETAPAPDPEPAPVPDPEPEAEPAPGPEPETEPAPAPKRAPSGKGRRKRSASQVKQPPKRYIPAIDGLRAFAVFAVILYHMGLPWAKGGLLGVTVFFVISGYLITGLLTAEWESSRTINLPQFWLRRIRRLFPAMVTVIVVMAAVDAFASPLLLTKMRPDIIPGLFWFENWWYIFRDLSYFEAAGAPSPLTHFWSLAIEEQFYLIWPIILLGVYKAGAKKKLVRRMCLVLAVISALAMALMVDPAGDPSRVYYGTDTRAFSLLIGAWLSFAWPGAQLTPEGTRNVPATSVRMLDAVGVAAFLGIVAMCVFVSGYSAFMYYGGLVLCSVLSAVVIAVLAHPRSMFAKIAASKPLVWIGQRSYGMYLWHFPIIVLLEPRNATMLPFWIHFVEIALILGVSHLSYKYIETPIRKQGFKEFFGKLRGKIPAIAAAGAVTLVAIGGIILVPPVSEGGVAPDEQRVMSATLKKPLVDGVYDVVFVGDSVSLGANEQLNEAFPHGLIDTEGNRQIYEVIPVFEDYIKQGIVGDTVVFSLSTNGYAEPEELEQLMNLCGPDRSVYFVNIRVPDNRCEPNNAAIQECVDKHENAHLLDWYSLTAGHDDWLSEDGIHLNGDGRAEFVNLIVDGIGYAAPSEENTRYDVTYIGDVVAIDAADQLAKLFPKGIVDCSDVRNAKTVLAAYQGYSSKDVVGDKVVFCPANEGLVSEADAEALVTAAGEGKTVWFVNARNANPWCTGNNDALAAVAAKHDNVHIIDWYAASAGHDDYLAADGMRLTDTGAEAYAAAVKEAMGL